MKNDPLLAFVHIEKTAGTTLKSIFLKNFGLGFCEVRPLSQESNRNFMASDLRTYLALNPMIRCISGHSVKPFVDIESVVPNVYYITLFRNPVVRYISYYTYGGGIPIRPWPFDFAAYLEQERFRNFQTKKIAGCADVELAKRILREQFLAVGITEEFDTFVDLLQRRFAPAAFDGQYEPKNVTPRNQYDKIYQQFKNQIVANNQADIELFEYVRSELIPAFENPEATSELLGSKMHLARMLLPSGRMRRRISSFGYRLYKKMGIDPLTGLLRKRHGLPRLGVY